MLPSAFLTWSRINDEEASTINGVVTVCSCPDCEGFVLFCCQLQAKVSGLTFLVGLLNEGVSLLNQAATHIAVKFCLLLNFVCSHRVPRTSDRRKLRVQPSFLTSAARGCCGLAYDELCFDDIFVARAFLGAQNVS